MRRERTGYLLILPVLLLIFGIYGYPLFDLARISFHQTRFGFGDLEFSGLANYGQILQDSYFHKALYNSLLWTVLNLILQLPIPLVLALMLNRKFRGNTLARVLMLVPWITPVVVVAILTRWILEPNLGIVNTLLSSTGLISGRISFLGSPQYALPTLMAVNTWQFIPFGTLLILAALQTVPREIYEAARVDGVGAWQLFRHILFPLLGSVIGFVGFLAFVWNFNTFALIWLTTQGGPLNTTLTLPVLIYRKAFRGFAMGEASAMATLVGIALVGLGILYFKYLWRRSSW
ncbi:MAG: carbohydrate ABC transporter permease [Candidatus Bipolaricaulia bacterium]